MKSVWLFLFLVVGSLAACQSSGQEVEPSKEDLHKLLDDWHQAAAEADFERYFSYFQNDSSIFMGTDATERWTVAEFRPWSKPYFDRGDAWNFDPVERHIYFSENGSVSWFDEELDTPNLGPARGSGVLVMTGEGWKIAHYNLSIPIPNAIVDRVVEQVDETLKNSVEE
jgi:hypothetical protein